MKDDDDDNDDSPPFRIFEFQKGWGIILFVSSLYPTFPSRSSGQRATPSLTGLFVVPTKESVLRFPQENPRHPQWDSLAHSQLPPLWLAPPLPLPFPLPATLNNFIGSWLRLGAE